MSNIWFTSDYHLNHAKAINFETRETIFESVEEMNERIIAVHNRFVRPDDLVYMLGDMVMGPPGPAAGLIARLNGRKRLIRGNHDTDAKIDNYIMANTFESITWADQVKFGKRHYFLSHYPVAVENHTKNPVWCLHGHTHQENPYGPLMQNLHIGWETYHSPIQLEDVEFLILNRPV